MMVGSKEEAMDLFERHRAEWLRAARAEASQIGMTKGTCTVDDIRKICPPPSGVDGRVMGAVFKTPEWEPGRHINSARKTCHKRPIRVFHWKGLSTPEGVTRSGKA